VNKIWEKNHRKEFIYRLWASDVRDEAFIERFYEGEEVERSLRTAENCGYYEEELGTLVDLAVEHYERYGIASLGRIPERDSQEGNIPPKKRRRSSKLKDLAGAWERQEALAQYLAGVASEDESIISFRKNVLSGRVLSEDQAMTFLSSPLAAARGKRASFKLLRINPLDRILDTSYEVEERQDDWGHYKKLVWGRRRSSTIRPLLAGRRPLFPGDSVTLDTLRILRRGRAIVFPHPREESRFVVAAQNSFIGQLVNLVEKRMGGYPISREMGVWFILTGEFVAEAPVRIRCTTTRRPELLSRTTITLEVESWLPPEEVLEQYRHAQHEIVGKTPRSLKRRTLAVFEFVNKHKEKSWRELLEAWNKEHRYERFEDRRHLYTTYTRAVENIAAVKPTRAKRVKASTN
jgi:hypothetical protein